MRNSYLPDDQLALVLVRLPLKCIFAFKSVSKSWNALISSPEFIKMHLCTQPTIDQKPNIIVKKIEREWGARTTSEQIHVVEFSTENLELRGEIQRLHHPFESLDIGKDSMIVGFCNGLLCQIFGREGYWDYEYGITLCNPLTKSSWNLPKRPRLVNDQNQKKKMSRRISCYGFGYDDVRDDYKVMIASSPPYYDTGLSLNIQEYEYEYEVYSQRSDSWSRLRSYLDSRYYSFSCPYSFPDGVLVNCALHWILRNNNPLYGYNHHPFYGYDDSIKRKNSILAFDLRTDKHKIFRLPKVLQEDEDLRLSVLNGCLLILSCRYNIYNVYRGAALSYSFDFWVMTDYGMKNSVIRIPIYGLQSFRPRSLTPVTLLNDNNDNIHTRKLICYDSYEGIIILCDLSSHQIQKFPAPGGYDYAKQFQFVGSLVQPYPPSSGDTSLYREAKKHSFFRRSQRLEEAWKKKTKKLKKA